MCPGDIPAYVFVCLFSVVYSVTSFYSSISAHKMNDKSLCTEDGLAAKTLYLKSLPTDLKETHLSDYFSAFGPLQSVRIHDHTSNSIGFVKFEEAEAAANALEMERHIIEGRTIEVEIADDCHHDEPTTNDELPIELTNLTGTEFMDLNDYCLRQILNRISAMDLCSMFEMADLSKIIRLRVIAKKVFVRRFRCIDLNKEATKESDIERLLLNFGSLMVYVATDSGVDADETIKLILIFCNSLKWLDLRQFTFDESSTWVLKKLFRKLERIYIHDCHFKGGAMKAFARCRSLLTLKVYDEAACMAEILQYTFPKMRSFHYLTFWCTSKTLLKDFISRHKGLTSLRMVGIEDDSVLLPAIAENCTELQELSLRSSGNKSDEQRCIYVSTMPALKNLKTLSIYGDRRASRFIHQLKHLCSLRELRLICVRFNDCIEKFLGELKSLQILTIQNCDKFTDFDVLAKLRGLQELHITSDLVVTFDLIYMVRRLADLNRLELQLTTPCVIDEVMQCRLAAARRKSGKAKGSLEISCNGITTHIHL
ncbi:uncharacterized protein LOC119077321 [Bradysia coprophila]|uniref:uncharacterized protein LOC119077321 n=1 Tax=Bradysia coprophila TaxID=38358 RepID=UPI00187D70EA|nr:uncharacterized protein LOC119077321 [Bradysia coprophila]